MTCQVVVDVVASEVLDPGVLSSPLVQQLSEIKANG